MTFSGIVGVEGRDMVSYSASRKYFLYGAGKADCAGQGVWTPVDSGVCFVAVPEVLAGAGEEIRTLSANVSASALVDMVVVGDLAAGSLALAGAVGVAGLGIANGLAPAVLEPGVAEKGLEKGLEFADTLLVSAVAPNKLAPKSTLGFGGAIGSAGLGSGLGLGFSSFFCGCGSGRPGRLTLRVARYARILPGLRLHGFLGHPNMYRRRSLLGKWSGRSPCNSRRSSIGLLQTLQLANSPGGGVFSSIHDYRDAKQDLSVSKSAHRSCLCLKLGTYWPTTKMADGVFYDLFIGVSEKHAGLGEILVHTRVTVVGIHGV